MKSLRSVHLSLAAVTTFSFFFFNDTATTEIYTLSLHGALPISSRRRVALPGHRLLWRSQRSRSRARRLRSAKRQLPKRRIRLRGLLPLPRRSEEHTSELQSLAYLVCRLLLEKKKYEITTLCSLVAGRRYYFFIFFF